MWQKLNVDTLGLSDADFRFLNRVYCLDLTTVLRRFRLQKAHNQADEKSQIQQIHHSKVESLT